MCGIIGIIGKDAVSDRVVEGLKTLEYRGYDSAGIATLYNGIIQRRRAVGKLEALKAALHNDPLLGNIGIGHTRWATHGKPTAVNAHPHQTQSVCLVHNGIIENYREIKAELTTKNIALEGETDSEVAVHYLSGLLEACGDPDTAMQQFLDRIEGAYALAILFKQAPDRIYFARKGSPLVVGVGEGENYIGSDSLALTALTRKVIYLEEGDWGYATPTALKIFDANNKLIDRPIQHVTAAETVAGKGNYRHFMLKEIHEQPTVVAQTLGRYLSPSHDSIILPEMAFDLKAVPKITLIACGTSYFAAQIARYWLEGLARIPVEVDIASEFRYRDPVYIDGGLTLFISQSGETADTLAALKHAKAAGQKIGVIVNVDGSSMAREADVVFPTFAGPEIGVASTKAFTCQLAVLAAIAIECAAVRGKLDSQQQIEMIKALEEIPRLMADVLQHTDSLQKLSREVARASDVLFLGRGIHYPIAMEGALKLKEISYIHAEGYAAGEMKHGPIALIDENMPVVVAAPTGPLFDKTISNMQEVLARGGRIILISDAEGIRHHGDGTLATIEMPKVPDFITPLIYVLPAQLLAYYTAVTKGTDVDQPRNLAKSVTVE